MRFHAEVQQAGKTATGIRIPPEVVESLGQGKRPPVRVTINGQTYRSTVAVMGGEFMVALSAENRTLTGVAAGDDVEVDVELDTAPREVVVPPDLAAALDRDAELRRRFDTLAYSHRKEHVRAIEEAKTPETRQRRIDKALSLLRSSGTGR